MSSADAEKRSFRLVEANALTRAELERAVEILHAAFPRWPGRYALDVPDVEHLRWKLEGGGAGPGSLTLIEVDGTIAGIALNQPLRLLVRGTLRRGRYATEAAVHPDYQGRGVYSWRRAATRALLDSLFDMSLGITHNPKMQHLRGKRGDPPMPNRLEVLLRVYHARRSFAMRRAAGSVRRAWFSQAERAAQRAWHAVRHPPRRAAGRRFSIGPVERFDERADDFAGRAARPFDLIQLRDRRFLAWRYLDVRAPRSNVLVAEQAGEMLGFVVHRSEDERGYLIDLLALPDRPDVVRALVRAADRALRESGVAQAECWFVRRHPYAGVLREHGFLPSRYPTGYSHRPMRLDPAELAFARRPDARIHLTLGDFDVV